MRELIPFDESTYLPEPSMAGVFIGGSETLRFGEYNGVTRKMERVRPRFRQRRMTVYELSLVSVAKRKDPILSRWIDCLGKVETPDQLAALTNSLTEEQKKRIWDAIPKGHPTRRRLWQIQTFGHTSGGSVAV
jgi:hypothetical protein